MWEPSSWNPQGSISLRKMFAFATALLVACFVYIIASAPSVFAADAEFNNNTLRYEGKQFSGPFTADGTNPSGVAEGVTYYVSPSADNPREGTVIYFARGIKPGEATTARTAPATLNNSGSVTAITTSSSKEITVGTSSSPDPPSSSCKVDGVGWIVCNLSNWIAEGVDYLYSILTKFMLFTPLTESGSGSSLYQLWNAVRNIANVAFVIAFIIIIYSEMTNNFLGSYTVKKLLPRIIVAAVLVNVSFWICALAIDLSNIIGVAIQDLFVSLRGALGAANTVDLPKWGDVTAGILSLGGITLASGAVLVASGGTIGGLVFLLLGALIPAIFAALVAVAVLAARQALITVLVVIAPLAFVAYLLPNTEQWFDKWRKFFLTLLIIFPAFSLLFGGSQIAGNIIIQNARDISVALLGLTVQVVPLFITPFLIKLSSGLLGTFAGLANNKSKGIFDRTKNWADNNRKMHQQRGFSKDQRKERKASLRRPTSLAQRLNSQTLKREANTSAFQESAAENFHGTKAYGKIDELKRLTAQDKMRNEGEHEAHWYQQFDRSNSHYSRHLLEREAIARASTTVGADAKKLMDVMDEEMKAGVNPLQARGFQDVPSEGLSSAISQSRTSAQSLAINAMREAATKNQAQSNIARALQDDVKLQVQAGGIQAHGSEIAKATAESTRIAESAKAIKAYEDASPLKAGDIDGMRAEFDDAVATGNIEKVRAYTNIMADSSNPGIKALREALKAHELTMPADMKEVLKIHIDSHAGINGAAEDIGTWSRDVNNTRSLSQIAADPATWAGLSATQFAGMKKSSQIEALNSGGIPEEIALAIWEGPAMQNLKTDPVPENNVQARIKELAMRARARQRDAES